MQASTESMGFMTSVSCLIFVTKSHCELCQICEQRHFYQIRMESYIQREEVWEFTLSYSNLSALEKEVEMFHEVQ